MKLAYFGDSYDIVKKSFIGWLSGLGEWAVHPMFTEQVSPQEAEAFGRFLGARILSTERISPKCKRNEYFSRCVSAPHLFVDPDTGVRMRPRTDAKSVNYVFADELIEWSLVRPHYLTAVFDQSYSRGKQSVIMMEKLRYFADREVHAFAYCSHAPLLVLSSNKDLTHLAWNRIFEQSRLPNWRLVRLSDQ